MPRRAKYMISDACKHGMGCRVISAEPILKNGLAALLYTGEDTIYRDKTGVTGKCQ